MSGIWLSGLMKRCFHLWILAILSLAGCVMSPRDLTPTAFRYPAAGLAGFREARYLRYEGKDVGLDGGSQVYLLSTPRKHKVALWSLCPLAKRNRGYDLAKNAFMLETGDRREDEHPVESSGELEALLVERLTAGLRRKEESPGQHRIEAEIIAMLQDRNHGLNTVSRTSP